jgi:hypothetical protein
MLLGILDAGADPFDWCPEASVASNTPNAVSARVLGSCTRTHERQLCQKRNPTFSSHVDLTAAGSFQTVVIRYSVRIIKRIEN